MDQVTGGRSHPSPWTRPMQQPTQAGVTRFSGMSDRSPGTPVPAIWRTSQPDSAWLLRANSSSRRDRAPGLQVTSSSRAAAPAGFVSFTTFPNSIPASGDTARQKPECASSVCIVVCPRLPLCSRRRILASFYDMCVSPTHLDHLAHRDPGNAEWASAGRHTIASVGPVLTCIPSAESTFQLKKNCTNSVPAGPAHVRISPE